jgi:PiT family inorganic phosphate transporter
MMIYLIILPFILTFFVCVLNGVKDGTYLFLPIFSNESAFIKYKKNKFLLLLPFFGEVLGATFLGEIVLKKVQYGFINPSNLSFNQLYICVIVILMVTLIIYFISSFLAFPISLSHTIIGGLIGAGLFFKLDINFKNLISTSIIWTITPILSLIAGLIIYKIILYFSLKSKKVLKRIKITGFIYILFIYIFFLIIFLSKSKLAFYILFPFFSLLILIFSSRILSKKSYKIKYSSNDNDNLKIEFQKTEQLFSDLSFLILPNVFISHGANDVANSISLFSLLVLSFFKNKNFANLKFYLLLIFSVILSFSIIIFGSKKAEKLSINICKIESSKIFTSYFSLAISTILFSFLGYRVSSIYTLTGSYIGIGYAKGFSIFNSKLLFTLLISWFITFALSILLSYFLFYIIKYSGVFLW